MAAVTLLGTATFNTTSGTKTVTATPAVGDLIVIIVAHSGSTSSVAPTDNNSSGTYTLINSAVKATSADTMRVYVRDSLITSATSTIFTHAPGTTTGGGLAVLKITGMEKVGSAAVRGSGKQDNQASATTPAPVLSSTPRTTNPIITAVFNASNPANTTVPTSYTSRTNSGYNTPATGLRVASIDSGITNATITWGGTSASAFGSLAIELDAALTHATTGALNAGSATIVGSAAHVAKHATTGALTGPGSTIVGSAARTRQHATTGALTGPGAAIVGSAARSNVVTHDTTGALNAGSATVAGTAARTRVHTTTGALTGPGADIDGAAARTRQHATTGVLTGPGADVDGAAARTRQHATTGALTGPGADVDGAAARTRVHTTTGVLTGPGADVDGAANRATITTHDTTGALAGPGAVVDGAARRDHFFDTAGVLTGPGAVVTGDAARSGAIINHATTGDLAGPGAVVEGAATRFRVHETSGALVGPGASLSGTALKIHPVNLCMTQAQAQKLYEIWLLHGLGPVPLVVEPTARTAGVLEQTVTDVAGTVTIQTAAGALPVDVDVGQMVDDLAALHGLDTTTLEVTSTSRTAGAISQTITTAGNVITVERQ